MSKGTDPLLDFRNFLFIVWKHLNLKKPTRRQYAIAHFLQHGPNRKMIQAWRGASKSWITYAYVCWRLYCDPQVNILVISASKAKADEFTTFTKRLISEIDCLKHLKPRRADQRWSSVSFDVGPAEPDPNPSVKSAGITGMVTGSRADEIIFDDAESPDNSATPSMREKLAEKIKEASSILKPLEEVPNARITYLGTPQTESSVYNLLPERGYTVRIWPARYPDEKQRRTYGDTLAPDILEDLEANPKLVGHSTEPTRFTDLDFAQREADEGRSRFALQYMLDTRLSDTDRYPLKLSDLCVMPLDPEMAPEKVIWSGSPEYVIGDLPIVGIGHDKLYRPILFKEVVYLKYTGIVMAIDPSGRGKDETGYAVVAMLNGQLFLLDAGGFRDGFGIDTLEGLALVAKRFKVNRVLIESNFGGGTFTALLRPHFAKHWPTTLEDVTHNTQKERRICDTLEPVMQSHRLVVNRALIQKDFDSVADLPIEQQQRYMLFYQLTRLTRDRGALANDDRLDALSMAVAHWTKALSQDVDKAVEAQRARIEDKETREFMSQVFGRKPKPVTWVPQR